MVSLSRKQTLCPHFILVQHIDNLNFDVCAAQQRHTRQVRIQDTTKVSIENKIKTQLKPIRQYQQSASTYGAGFHAH